jgi:hypothetical protein
MSVERVRPSADGQPLHPAVGSGERPFRLLVGRSVRRSRWWSANQRMARWVDRHPDHWMKQLTSDQNGRSPCWPPSRVADGMPSSGRLRGALDIRRIHARVWRTSERRTTLVISVCSIGNILCIVKNGLCIYFRSATNKTSSVKIVFSTWIVG